MKAGFSIKLIYFAPNCPQQIVAPNCPTPNCPRRIVLRQIVRTLGFDVSLLGQAVVHCGPLFMAIWWSHLPANATMQSRSFSMVGPKPGTFSQFHQFLKTVLFRLVLVGSASE